MERATRTRRQGSDRLSRRIIDAAIAILDEGGEKALTFVALAKALKTGSGAIYWHVADRSALLSAAADAIATPLLTAAIAASDPRESIRTTAMAMFDAIDAHPWIAVQIARDPEQPTTLLMFERIGGALQRLDTEEGRLFEAWSALVNYILGAAVQNAENGRQSAGPTRTASLQDLASRWAALDATAFPFLRRMSACLPDHDDRDQFLAGVDLILDGVERHAAAAT